jgi:hypothetical protein
MTRSDAVKRLANTRLFRRTVAPLSPWQVIGWWELRRPAYNLIVGLAGLVTIIIMVVVSVICDKVMGVPIGMPDPPIFAVLGVIVYAVMANVFFTCGWLVELFLVHALGSRRRDFGQVAFGLGLAGSVFLTLLPAVVTVVSAAVALVAYASGVRSPTPAPGS